MAGRIPLWLLRRDSDRMLSQLAEMRAIFEALLPTLGGEPSELPAPSGHGHMPTSTSGDGRIVTPEGLPPTDVSDAIKRYWPESIWTDAARVSYVESAGWNHRAERNTLDRAGGRCNVPIGYINGVRIVSEQSVGLFQINVCAHGHDRDYWQDVDNNVRYARRLYDDGGWNAWQFTATKLGLIGG